MSAEPLYHQAYSSPQSARNGRKLILSVDDEPGVLRARFLLLSAAGYAVLSTTDAANALQLFAKYPVDLVLLDYMMPEIDGGLIAQAMKEYEPRVPIIMVTGVELSQESLAAVNRYLRKAQDPDELLQAVQDLIPSSIRTRFPTRP